MQKRMSLPFITFVVKCMQNLSSDLLFAHHSPACKWFSAQTETRSTDQSDLLWDEKLQVFQNV